MNNAVYTFRLPENEPVKGYALGSPERESLKKELERQRNLNVEIPLVIGGKEIRTDDIGLVVAPHDHQHVLARYHKAGPEEVQMAINAAMHAKEAWADMSYVDRASVFLKVAELLATKYRDLINASTMLGQSKTPHQAEIDAACEVIDFFRFNAYYMSQIYQDQPWSDGTMLNRVEYRPLEGFVFAVSPFNFTSIASNLAGAPAMMGNTVVWKPATTSLLSNYYLMKVYEEAGLPAGVINFVPSSGSVIGKEVMGHKDFGAIHFTGSNNTFNHLWKETAKNMTKYVSYPKLVGETGGKDYVFAHSSADPQELATALARGAFEYQGQKCSAASRAYVPASLWDYVSTELKRQVGEFKMGDPTKDFTTFMGAVIDEASFDSIMAYVQEAHETDTCTFLTGGKGDKSKGYFIEPTVIVTTDPKFSTMQEELFGPVLTIYVYNDEDFDTALDLCNETSPYALTGAIFGRDRHIVNYMMERLRYNAGNFYINDKPTGAVVGQQPFGGARGSGTNDKAGSYLNLIRWTNPRTIKETFNTARDFRYPYMDAE